VREVISVLADYERVAPLLALHRKHEMSWKEIFDRLDGNTEVRITVAQADALAKNGFGVWSGSGRMIITARCETFAKLSDLSARVGFDRNGEAGECLISASQKVDWIGPFLRSQFLKRERAV